MTTQQRIERIECPWPESVWRMTREQYVAAIPDEALRTSISGFLMREGWKVAMGQVRDELAALTAFAEEQEKECRQKLIVDPDDKRSLLELVIQERNLTEDLADQLDRANIAHHELMCRYQRTQDHWIESQNEATALRAQLAETQHARDVASNAASRFKQAYEETQEKLKEAEKNVAKVDESILQRLTGYETMADELLALQAHVETLRSALEELKRQQGAYDYCWYVRNIIDPALSSRPDLPLIEEVREAIGAQILGKAPLVYIQEQFPATVGHVPLNIWFNGIYRLLTRLNP